MITSPTKVLYAKTKHTKNDVWKYYQQIFPVFSKYLQDRPVSLVRAPEGVEKVRFYQRHPGEYFPSYIERVKLDAGQGSGVYICIDALEDIEYLVNIGTIEFHIWGSTVHEPEYQRNVLFDLDPGPKVTQERLVEAAHILKQRMEWEGFETQIKTSGIKGYHIEAKLPTRRPYSQLLADARHMAHAIAKKSPRLFTDTIKKSERDERIFIDYLRNRYGATNVAPFSLRAWHTPTVSVPISWDELESTPPDAFTIDHVAEFLARSRLWV